MFERFKSTKQLRAKIRNGQVVGAWMQTKSTQIAEIIGGNGFDFVTIDMEHGEATMGDIKDLFTSIELAGSVPVVRCINKSSDNIVRLLELGACGLIFPNIESVEDVIDLEKKCFYPPRGSRGVGFNRANKFGENLEDAMKNEFRPIMVGMIESVSVKNIKKILNCDFDSILIGPYDLSTSVGKTGLLNCDEMKNMIKEITNACDQNNVAVGLHVVSVNKQDLNGVRAKGMRFNVYGMDTLVMAKCYSINE